MGWIASGSEGTLQRCIQSVFAEGLALFAINTAPHGTIKCFPFYLKAPEYNPSASVGMRIAVRSRFLGVSPLHSKNRIHFFFRYRVWHFRSIGSHCRSSQTFQIYCQ